MHFDHLSAHFWQPLARFWHPLAPFGSLLAPFWLPFAPFGLPLAPFGRPFGSKWLAFGVLWRHFGYPGVNFLIFRVTWRHFWCLFYTFDGNMIKLKVFSWFLLKIWFDLAPQPAKPLQITVCTLSFERHTTFQGPERVHCRRQLRSAPGRRRPRRVGVRHVLRSLSFCTLHLQSNSSFLQ